MRDVWDKVTENVRELCPSAACSKAMGAVSRQCLEPGGAFRQPSSGPSPIGAQREETCSRLEAFASIALLLATGKASYYQN